MVNYNLPVKVSPLIKGARWIALISGYFYGKTKLVTYTYLAQADRDRRERLKNIKEEILKEMKLKKKELREQKAKCGCD
ncbi:hypothetical protein FQR65_LT02586 [Abscondita terminalis]|nr:hypothetical protein FQR65_LT02586 [Abscondita terminalis]